MTPASTSSSGSSKRVRAFPERVERYELLLPIGSGGSATVYLARTPLLDGVFREVAIKLMHPKLDAGDGQFASELIDEARLVAAIRHPNVVSILEVGDSAEGVYLVMDYVRGDTLSGVIRELLQREEQLPLDIAARILADALLGLHTAHELVDDQGKSLELVHRDFSPQNLLVGVDGVTRLTDFGIAKVTGRISGTASGVVKGKVGYMSPEQALGERLDRRSDIWAAGVVAWELLAQRRLYEGEGASVLLSIVSKDPEDVRSVRRDCPEACAQVIARALSRDRAVRYDTALELRDALLQAFRASTGVAESDAVARLVGRVVEPRLVERAQQARAIDELRSSLQQGQRALGKEADAAARPSRRWAVTLPLLLLALVVLTAYFARRSSEPSARGAALPEPSAAGLPSSATPVVASVAAATSEAAAAARLLRLTSEVPISGLMVGGQAIYVPKPTTSVTVQLPSDVAFPVTIQARAADGRSLRTQLPSGADQLSLSFSAPKPAGGGPRHARQPASGASSMRELAPPPYE